MCAVLSAPVSGQKKAGSRWGMEKLSFHPSLLSSYASHWPAERAVGHLQMQPHAWLTWLWNLLAVASGTLEAGDPEGGYGAPMAP